MAMIQTISPEKAGGKVAHIYGQIHEVIGRVPNGMQLFSSSPELLEQQWQNMGYYIQHPTLSFPLLAMVRMLVSQDNQCEYCVGMNENMLINMAGLSVDQVMATKQNPQNAPLEEKDKAMLLFVLKATQNPKTVQSADLDQLKALGWTESEIMDAVFHGARNIAIDVVFNTFKIENDL